MPAINAFVAAQASRSTGNASSMTVEDLMVLMIIVLAGTMLGWALMRGT